MYMSVSAAFLSWFHSDTDKQKIQLIYGFSDNQSDNWCNNNILNTLQLNCPSVQS